MPADSNSLTLLTPPELARLLRISIPGVYRLVEKRELPVYRIRRSLRFREADVAEYLKRQRVEPVGLQ